MNAAKKSILLLLWLVVTSFTTASALTPGATETRVGQKSLAAHESRQVEPLQTPGLPQRNATCGYELAPDSLLAAESGASRLRLNIFGQREAPGFLDVSTSARYATGTDGIVRPLTTSLPNGSASDIFIRWSPLSSETLSEITRLSAPGTRVTLMQSLDSAGAFQSQRLIDAFGSRATVTLQRTFTSQFQLPGDTQGILKLLIHE